MLPLGTLIYPQKGLTACPLTFSEARGPSSRALRTNLDSQVSLLQPLPLPLEPHWPRPLPLPCGPAPPRLPGGGALVCPCEASPSIPFSEGSSPSLRLENPHPVPNFTHPSPHLYVFVCLRIIGLPLLEVSSRFLSVLRLHRPAHGRGSQMLVACICAGATGWGLGIRGAGVSKVDPKGPERLTHWGEFYGR